MQLNVLSLHCLGSHAYEMGADNFKCMHCFKECPFCLCSWILYVCKTCSNLQNVNIEENFDSFTSVLECGSIPTIPNSIAFTGHPVY